MSEEPNENPGFLRNVANSVMSVFGCRRQQQYEENDRPMELSVVLQDPPPNIVADTAATAETGDDIDLAETLEKLKLPAEQLSRNQPQIPARQHDNTLTPVE